ncbi:tRNA (guanosine(37)-N1)-methyltransferase TrmD [Leptospira sp. GIMC2001]|uniref:tRNA (guanosine(37)-N1)-methyltransferase TrmD n=1 Tax=Leptospira sp. GIMC2001 TaxID=1513297 RepID=UPI002349A529|nr:tRNA (guanosine(37)-N1)-methyltransferase TrmD [Leptospira sp. GIMC2001]WCL47923.1 tRNA (guanosine(37)-N1)-methyltransferase TrmD [Leptospira sp. GIMC2001]
MLFNFITLFPERIHSFFQTGVPGKAIEKKIIQINTIQLRDFAGNKHNRIDDTIYGGGPGMLLQVGPIYRALESLGDKKGHVVLLSAAGETFQQSTAEAMQSQYDKITFISGYYEGVDARVSEHLIDREVALGNYVISSGDIAAICVADCISRLIPGYLGRFSSLQEESHNLENVLEYPQYTKPREFMGWTVPEVLVDGNHKEINVWREANRRTQNIE